MEQLTITGLVRVGDPPAPAPSPPAVPLYITSQKPIGSKGDPRATVVIIGEAPGEQEMRKGLPFVGASGNELDKMLADTGIITFDQHPETKALIPNYSGVFFTNVTLIRPPGNDIEKWVKRAGKSGKAKRTLKGKNITPAHWVEHRGWLVEPHVAEDAKLLVKVLQEMKPTVAIALGNTSFWALCKEGITGKVGTWRGSTLLSDVVDGLKVIPAYHPAFVLRQWQHRPITLQDFRRAKHQSTFKEMENPGWDFTIAPSYTAAAGWLSGVVEALERGPLPLVVDIEGAQKKTLCVSVATSDRRAICIPILYRYRFYFEDADQRWVIHTLLHRVLTHPNARVTGQNIGFDTQFLLNDLLIYPNIHWDTMISQNVLWPGTPKNLAYQASMYCRQYRYWKDDSDEFWKKKRIDNWEQIWFYNCEDAARTFEVQQRHADFLRARNLEPQNERLQKRTFPLIRKAMFRGVRVDAALKKEMLEELVYVVNIAQERVNYLATRKLDIASPAQLQDFFYKELKLKPILNDENRPTCDADALVLLAEKEPLVREVVRWINLCRSYQTAISVCTAETDPDGRWRCSYSLGLVETYRLSSSKNPYGRGLNLMNITSGKDVKDGEDD